MGLTLRAAGSALYQAASRFMLFLGGNIAAMVLSIPLIAAVFLLSFLVRSLGVAPLGVALLVGVLPNPGAMGLHALAWETAGRERAELADQWAGLKRHWRFALKVWSISALVSAVCLLNVVFYAVQAAEPSSSLHMAGEPLTILWSMLLIFWLGMHLYVAPLILARERDEILLVYRNAAVLALSRPLTTWTLTLLWIAVLVLSSVTGLITVIGLAVGSLMQHNALRLLLPTFSPAPE
jgi:hypothetical protein